MIREYLGVVYCADLIVHIVLMLLICKLVYFLWEKLNDATFWELEVYYRNVMRLRHENGDHVWHGINDNWLLMDVLNLMAFIMAVQKCLILLTIGNSYRVNNIFKQIISFHENHPNISYPNINFGGLDGTVGFTDYICSFIFLNIFIGGASYFFDYTFEDWRTYPLEPLYQAFKLIFLLYLVWSLSTLITKFAFEYNIGITELESVLGYE